MGAGALTEDNPDSFPLSAKERSLLFTSGNRQLRTAGLHYLVTEPVNGRAFRRSVSEAFNRVGENGRDNPIMIGAIPFDHTKPSCLYVPENYEWQRCEDGDATPSIERNVPTSPVQRCIPDEEGFKRAVKLATLNFQLSDVRKAVLSVVRELQFPAPVDTNRLLSNLRAQNRHGYQFRIPLSEGGELIGASPELLLRMEGDRIVTNPLAGSAKRSSDPDADMAIAARLQQSEKDLYEHRLVVEDIERLLKPHCAELDVPERPSLLSTSVLWHLSSRIEGRVRDRSMTALQLACLLHPTPAVCGFPTGQAFRLIRFIEPFERGLFSGIVGWCDAEGNGEWVITIRCGIVDGATVRLFAGAGIVEGSQPASEWAEVQTKLSTMLNACGIST